MNQHAESAVRISLVDVMYGIILAYGFNFFDDARGFWSYMRFFFAYAIIIVDWLYVHKLYWAWEYKSNFVFILDVLILFLMSRLISASTTCSNHTFVLWLALLFACYLLWDVVSWRLKVPSEYDWRYSVTGDFAALVLFLTIYILAVAGLVLFTASWNMLLVAVYFAAFSTWFKKKRKLPIPGAARPPPAL